MQRLYVDNKYLSKYLDKYLLGSLPKTLWAAVRTTDGVIIEADPKYCKTRFPLIILLKKIIQENQDTESGKNKYRLLTIPL